ncbi:MAG: class I SAM-dependent methyltransferase [Bacteroidia bacterium]|nr:class I SAM-dependent methyltransferase [Bacteroidia bacterium]NND52000.1 class I SAM-dependent methyltransferase [Flavobacteriaceae bacterium]
MDDKKVYLEVKDHSVSGEEFSLLYNPELEMLSTYPMPSETDLATYYESKDYISHTGSRRNFFERLYHGVRKIALKRKLNLITSFNSESKTLLDIGCGTGEFLELAISHKWKAEGIEPNEKARAMANEKTSNAVYDIEALNALKPHSFDVITLWHVLEHLPQLEDHISIFKRLVKPNGRLVVAVPNFKSFDASYYKSFWAAYDVPRHLWHFSQTAIAKLFANEEMKIESIKPMKFDAYYVSLLSEKYKSGWMNIFSAFFVATRSNLKASRTGEFSSLIYVLKNS